MIAARPRCPVASRGAGTCHPTAMIVRATVRNGKYVIEEPAELPEGSPLGALPCNGLQRLPYSSTALALALRVGDRSPR